MGFQQQQQQESSSFSPSQHHGQSRSNNYGSSSTTTTTTNRISLHPLHRRTTSNRRSIARATATTSSSSSASLSSLPWFACNSYIDWINLILFVASLILITYEFQSELTWLTAWDLTATTTKRSSKSSSKSSSSSSNAFWKPPLPASTSSSSSTSLVVEESSFATDANVVPVTVANRHFIKPRTNVSPLRGSAVRLSADTRQSIQRQKQQRQDDKDNDHDHGDDEDDDASEELLEENVTNQRPLPNLAASSKAAASIILSKATSSSSSSSTATFSTASSSTTNTDRLDPSAWSFPKLFQRYPAYGYRSTTEMNNRSQRFPNPEQRLQSYMGAWYVPPPSICHESQQEQPQSHYDDIPPTMIVVEYYPDAATARAYNMPVFDETDPNAPIRLPYYVVREAAASGAALTKENSANNGRGSQQKQQQKQKQRIFAIDGRIFDASNHSDFNRLIALNTTEIWRCHKRFNQCESDRNTMLPAMERLAVGGTEKDEEQQQHKRSNSFSMPLLLQYGDTERPKAYELISGTMQGWPRIPLIKKFRVAVTTNGTVASDDNRRVAFGGQKMMVSNNPVVQCRNQTRDDVSAVTATGTVRSNISPRLLQLHNKQPQPILWKQKIKRHYGMFPVIAKVDVPWHEKRNQVVFRGAMTGIYAGSLRARDLVSHESSSLEVDNDNNGQDDTQQIAPTTSLSDREKCMMIPRCRLVYQTAHSDLVDAKLTDDVLVVSQPVLYDETNGTVEIRVFGDRLDYKEMLQYKAILMPQGNDVSTGMKWAMLSKSVVLFPPPTMTSWPMEEWMQPWVHYIPVRQDFSDVEQKMQWILEHDIDAQEIANHGSMWMRDLIIHPDAEHEELWLYQQIIRRYRHHFVMVPPGTLLPGGIPQTTI